MVNFNLLSPCVAAAVLAVVSMASASSGIYGNGYPLFTDLTCAMTKSGGGNNRGASNTQLLYLNTTSGRLHLADLPDNVIQVWNGYEGIGDFVVPTLWNSRSPQSHYPNYVWTWSDAAQSFKSSQEQPHSNICFGYRMSNSMTVSSSSPTLPQAELIMVHCNNTNTSFSTRFKRLFTGKTTSRGNFSIFLLQKLDGGAGMAVCVGVPQQFTQSASLQSSQFRITIGVGGLGPNRNYTYVQSLQILQPGFNKNSGNRRQRKQAHEKTSSAMKAMMKNNSTATATATESRDGDESAWSINLLDSAARIQSDSYSMSSITFTEDSSQQQEEQWKYAQGGAFTTITETSIVLDGIEIGDVAMERWTFSLSDAAGLTWKVERTYKKSIMQLGGSRYAFFVFQNNFNTPGMAPPEQQAPIVSTLDPTFSRNQSSATGSSWHTRVSRNKWVYAYSNRSSNSMTLSPADACMTWTKQVSSSAPSSSGNNIQFALSWATPSGYSLGHNSFGLLSTDPVPVCIAAGTSVSAALTLKLNNADSDDEAGLDLCEGPSKMTFSTGNATRDAALRKYVRQFAMWAGNMQGNSPSSVSCIFETFFYAAQVSIMDPPLPTSSSSAAVPELFQSLRYQLDLFLKTQVLPNGAVIAQWSERGSNPGDYNNNFIHQQTQLLNAVYYYAVTTGDMAFIKEHFAHGGALRNALFFLLDELGLAKTGLSHCMGNATGNPYSTAACTWLDIISMGGTVAFLNSEALQVLSGYSDMAAWIGDADIAELLENLFERSKTKFVSTFWNESAELFADWVGDDGQGHTFAYIWNQGLAADIFARASSSGQQNEADIKRIQRIAASIDRLYVAAQRQTGVDLFMTPTNLISVPAEFQPAWVQAFLVYENGAGFSLMPYFENLLRFATGLPEQRAKAIALVDRMLADFAETRAWGQHYEWEGPRYESSKLGSWAAGDVLTDAVMLAVGVLRGGMRLRPTLTQGILLDGEAGAELEGWTWTFYHLGNRVKATVVNGKTQIQNLK